MLDYIFYSAHGLKADLSDLFLELTPTDSFTGKFWPRECCN